MSNTGYRGITYDSRRRKPYYVQIRYDNKNHNLGYYATLEEARFVLREARKEHPDGRRYSELPTGVYKTWRKNQPYYAMIRTRGKAIYLGAFDSIEEASKAYETARAKIPNGRTARRSRVKAEIKTGPIPRYDWDRTAPNEDWNEEDLNA